jgi:hypothetical protein
MVIGRIFRPKGSEIIGGWRKLHNELRNLYSSPNIIRMIKSGRMIWVRHAVCVREKRKIYIVIVGKTVKLSLLISY